MGSGRDTSARFLHGEDLTSSLTAPLWILAALLLGFVLISLAMVYDHAWTDSLTSRLRLPGTGAVLAADPALAAQIRVIDARAWNTQLADQTPALVAEAVVANDALMPVRRIVLQAEARAGGLTLAVAKAACGKQVSKRLLGRIGREELETLLGLDAPASVAPGRRLGCQIAFAGIRPGTEEVALTVASVEPSPRHRAPSFRPAE